MGLIDAYLPGDSQSENLSEAGVQAMEWITTIADRVRDALRGKKKLPAPELEPEDPTLKIKKFLAIIEAAENDEEALAGLVGTQWKSYYVVKDWIDTLPNQPDKTELAKRLENVKPKIWGGAYIAFQREIRQKATANDPAELFDKFLWHSWRQFFEDLEKEQVDLAPYQIIDQAEAEIIADKALSFFSEVNMMRRVPRNGGLVVIWSNNEKAVPAETLERLKNDESQLRVQGVIGILSDMGCNMTESKERHNGYIVTLATNSEVQRRFWGEKVLLPGSDKSQVM